MNKNFIWIEILPRKNYDFDNNLKIIIIKFTIKINFYKIYLCILIDIQKKIFIKLNKKLFNIEKKIKLKNSVTSNSINIATSFINT